MALSDVISYVVMGLLGLAIVLLIVFLIYRNQQTNSQINQTLFHTFSMYDDDPSNPAELKCPSGTSISVIDARYEVADPYKQCQTLANGQVISGQQPIAGCQISGQSTVAQGPWQCSIVDATPYVGLLANGKNDIVLSFSDNIGPVPCQQLGSNRTNLPQPKTASGQKAGHQGYTLHGIYTCVPD